MTSGRPAFQQHAEHTKSGDTTPRLAHAENHERRMYKSTISTKAKRSRSPAGPRRLETATRISASLFRGRSVFFRSASGQDPEAAKYAVLPPGHAGFPNHAKRSEGSDSAPPHPKCPCFAVCALVCDLSSKGECVPTFACESKRGPFVGEVEKRDERWSEIEFEAAALTDFSLLLVLRVHSEPGNVCI